MLDKAAVDTALFRHRNDPEYRSYCDSCPCCGYIQDRRGVPARHWVIRFLRFQSPDGADAREAQRFRCRSCGALFIAIIDGPELVGFREILKSGRRPA